MPADLAVLNGGRIAIGHMVILLILKATRTIEAAIKAITARVIVVINRTGIAFTDSHQVLIVISAVAFG